MSVKYVSSAAAPASGRNSRIREAVAPRIRHAAETHVSHLLAQDRAARAHDATEKNRVGMKGRDLRQQRLVVERECRQVLAPEERSAVLREGACKDVREAAAVRLVIIDHECTPQTAAVGERRGRGSLAIVGRANAKKRGARPERPSAAARRRGLASTRSRSRPSKFRRGPLRSQSGSRPWQRSSSSGRPPQRPTGSFANERRFSSALRRVVLALHRVVEIVQHHAATARKPMARSLLECEHDGVTRRDRARTIDARERQVEPELHLGCGRATGPEERMRRLPAAPATRPLQRGARRAPAGYAPVARWRRASKSKMPAATDALSESSLPNNGIRTKKSHSLRTTCEMPSPSAPITIATSPRKSAAV